MNTKELLDELDSVIQKLKIKIVYYQVENEKLKKRITELKKFVKEQ
jgi:cell division septum initiation protein DivIVA